MEGIYLPEEIWTKILLNLPAKSLMRLSCVSKTWYSLIRGDPCFGDKHLNHYFNKNKRRRNNAVFLIRQLGSLSNGSSKRYHELLLTPNSDELDEDDEGNYDYDYIMGNNISLFILSPDLGLPPCESPRHLYGSCNGIVCISKSKSCRGPVYLCNPTIREYMRLPDSSWDMKGCWDKSVLGFGFDTLTNDYKVLRLGVLGNNTSQFIYAEIYKLSTNCWTKLDFKSKGSQALGTDFTRPGNYWEYRLIRKLVPCGGLFVNGSCYWSGLVLGVSVILRFDFSTEIFSLMMHPYWNTQDESFVTATTPSVLGDSLALVIELNRGLLQLWVMEEEEQFQDVKKKTIWKQFQVRKGKIWKQPIYMGKSRRHLHVDSTCMFSVG